MRRVAREGSPRFLYCITYYIRYPWVILIDINCNTDFGGLEKSAAHSCLPWRIQRYHGTIHMEAICNTMQVLECAADSVLLTRYVIREQISNRNTKPAAKNFFAGACITIPE